MTCSVRLPPARVGWITVSTAAAQTCTTLPLTFTPRCCCAAEPIPTAAMSKAGPGFHAVGNCSKPVRVASTTRLAPGTASG